MKRPKIGLVLGSGSARGWAHVGVLLELKDHKIPIDVIGGTSVGALFGAFYACGKLENIIDFGLKLQWDTVARYYLPTMPRGGLIKNASIERFISKFFDDCDIDSLNIPFVAVAADALNGAEVAFTSGSLYHALRGSMAIPGIVEPLWAAPHLLVDGGIVNPIPIINTRQLGADKIIAVNLNSYKMNQTPEPKKKFLLPKRLKKKYGDAVNMKKLTGWLKSNFEIDLQESFRSETTEKLQSPLTIFDVFNNAFYIMQMEISRKSIHIGKPEVELKPKMENVRMLDFLKAEQGIKEGRRVVRQSLNEIEALLES